MSSSDLELSSFLGSSSFWRTSSFLGLPGKRPPAKRPPTERPPPKRPPSWGQLPILVHSHIQGRLHFWVHIHFWSYLHFLFHIHYVNGLPLWGRLPCLGCLIFSMWKPKSSCGWVGVLTLPVSIFLDWKFISWEVHVIVILTFCGGGVKTFLCKTQLRLC